MFTIPEFARKRGESALLKSAYLHTGISWYMNMETIVPAGEHPVHRHLAGNSSAVIGNREF
jgi:hypothetical protein